MKNYKVLLQAPYIEAAVDVFTSFIMRSGNVFSEVVHEVTEYFGIDPELVSKIFESEWREDGIHEFDTDGSEEHVDVLLLVVRRGLHLTGVQIKSTQFRVWQKYPEILRKGITTRHVAKLKVRVKKMGLVWKTEGYV
jgi:hypothetical protein